MSDYILEMNHITKEFSGVKALDDVNLKVKKGEIHALCGENGAGKSTLMNVLSGVYPYGTYSGEVRYKGEENKFHNLKDSEAKGIVIIHQELALSPLLSVAENVFLGNEQTRFKGVIDWTKTRKHAQEMLAKVGLENEDVNVPVSSLGVGKQQLIEIAKAMAKTYYKSLISAGIKIYEYLPGFDHGKMFVSDDCKAVVGTINLDYRSLYHHFECATYLSKKISLKLLPNAS